MVGKPTSPYAPARLKPEPYVSRIGSPRDLDLAQWITARRQLSRPESGRLVTTLTFRDRAGSSLAELEGKPAGIIGAASSTPTPRFRSGCSRRTVCPAPSQVSTSRLRTSPPATAVRFARLLGQFRRPNCSPPYAAELACSGRQGARLYRRDSPLKAGDPITVRIRAAAGLVARSGRCQRRQRNVGYH